jgi:probable phosphoglycerate mutase
VTARRILLWRHGRTAWNVERRFQGQADPPLDAVGRAQAIEAAAMVATYAPVAVVSSDLVRARETAAPLAARLDLPIALDPRLRERSLGHWEGLTRTEVARLYPTELADWLAGREDCQPGSEPRATVAARATAALADTVGDTVVLVTHSATAIALTGRLLGLPQVLWRGVGPLANCHWSELRADDHGWRLRAHNIGPPGQVVPVPVTERLAEEEPPDAEALDAGPPLAPLARTPGDAAGPVDVPSPGARSGQDASAAAS